jgi:excinuclease ABC subunit C
MTEQLKAKLAALPTTPGVYFHKSKSGEIIYVGKAANLRNRVRQYFQSSRGFDPKTNLLVKEIADVDWIEVETEADALFLEAEQVRRNMPRYNILLRDDKSMQFIRIDCKSDYPTVQFVRRPLDDKAEYFGPYPNGLAVKKALRYLRRAFPYAISRPVNQKRANLHYHLGLDPGLEEGRTSLEEYRANLRKLMQYLRGQRVALTKEIEKEMKIAAKAQDFEKAAHLRNQLFALRELNRKILFSDAERLDISKDHALAELAELLGLDKPPRRIEGYDISHMQGTDVVASMVVFFNGAADKTSYRKFKIRGAGNDDFANLNETLTRRFREENVKKWGLPDLILIDGGKGQLQAGVAARDARAMSRIPAIGLAKRLEEIIISKAGSLSVPHQEVSDRARLLNAYVSESEDFVSILLPSNSHIVKLLQRIRDESHRFAVSYHSTLKRNRHIKSVIDEIPGVGPITKKKLLRRFGSVRGITQASPAELAEALGPKKAQTLQPYLNSYREEQVPKLKR